VLGEHLDLDLPGHLVEDAAGVAHAVRRAHQMHGDLERDLLLRVDLVEIDVDDVGPDRVALDLADQRFERLPVHGQLDERARRIDAR